MGGGVNGTAMEVCVCEYVNMSGGVTGTAMEMCVNM